MTVCSLPKGKKAWIIGRFALERIAPKEINKFQIAPRFQVVVAEAVLYRVSAFPPIIKNLLRTVEEGEARFRNGVHGRPLFFL
ncbi:MAG: hypothetical protein LBB98_14305 [Treponema sp.]|nr:hypothetical protein [Treponema sp.]